MKNLSLLIAAVYLTLGICYADLSSLLPLPDKSALKIESQAIQTLEEQYLKESPNASQFQQGIFKQSYLSDGIKIRLENQVFWGNNTKQYQGQVITYDGKILAILRDPGAILYILKIPLKLNSANGNEQSPFAVFDYRNPLRLMYQWLISPADNEVQWYSYDHFIEADKVMASLLAKATSKTLKNGISALAVSVAGINPTGNKARMNYEICFDPQTHQFLGWVGETQDSKYLYEYKISDWQEFDLGGGHKIQLPKRAILTWSVNESGAIAKLTTYDVSILSVSLVNSDQAHLFSINPQLAKAFYDEKLGASVPIRK